MSISSALSNALSGLSASSRAADIISSNIANAMTDGYGTRRLDTASRVIGNAGAGVSVVGVTRYSDEALIGQRRVAEADLGASRARADFMAQLEGLIGAPDAVGNLSARVADFEGKLITAANAPWNESHLSSAVLAAQSMATGINDVSNGIQEQRLQADGQIAITVDRINGALESLADLNTRIVAAQAGGGEAASLLDAQAQLVEQIVPFIPLQSRRDEAGALYLYSDDGEALLDVRPATLGFTPVAAIAADMTLANGDLSGLTLNGRSLSMDGAYPALGGGELQAMFQLRDQWAPEAQARLDAVARDLVERFDAPGLDGTIATGSPGLFTDAGNLAIPANEIGLAGRLRINVAVDPDQGGAVWRLRDGIGATAEGPTGNATFLTAQVDALAALRPTVSGGFSGAARSAAGLISENLSAAGLRRSAAESELAQIAARHSALESAERAGGVDSDDELQRLLMVEQMFAANARVITAAEEMMDELMRIAR
ncbi:flagellar hook-associated protein FlgK [Hasllibacter sp. MH4015]|uniref:flagellar hook-associated protein FlgK n=1 Tax=Hasllibacter sp. MH4015 TaxID=2854029 RepID=UPI001CD64AD6|nr:flagellar hook-associated protein FlgK [Hasllibacter sp. MH4015]